MTNRKPNIKIVPNHSDESSHNGEFVMTWDDCLDRTTGCYDCRNQETILYVGYDSITVPRINPDAAVYFAYVANLI